MIGLNGLIELILSIILFIDYCMNSVVGCERDYGCLFSIVFFWELIYVGFEGSFGFCL